MAALGLALFTISSRGPARAARPLTEVRDLGLCLISVRRLDTGQAETRHHAQT